MGDDLSAEPLNRINGQAVLDSAPSCYEELVITFERDFDVQQVSDLLGLQPAEQRRQGCTRLNPVTGKQNPGYWIYRSEGYRSFECGPFFQKLSSFLLRHEQNLKTVCALYAPCEIYLHLFIEVNREGEYPVVRLPPALLRQLGELGVTLDIVTENNYETPEDKKEFEELTRTFSGVALPHGSGSL